LDLRRDLIERDGSTKVGLGPCRGRTYVKALAPEHGEDSLQALIWLRDNAVSEQVRLGATTAIAFVHSTDNLLLQPTVVEVL